MIVMKFGGTSVGNAERIHRLIRIVNSYKDQQPVLVVSAMAGVTNLLISASEYAEKANYNAMYKNLDEITQIHLQCIENLFDDRRDSLKPIIDQVLANIKEVRNLLEGVAILKELTLRTSDLINSYGERISAYIISQSLNVHGVKARLVDARDIMVTDNQFGGAQPLLEKVKEHAENILIPILASNVVPVLGGFIGRTEDGITSTLGRGGSDYTAAIIGLSIHAKEIQIWTDVDGILTCDPRVVKNARVLPQVSFHEASELAFFGAKVLHPSTIKPAVEKDIPVKILNSFNPEGSGTLITNQTDTSRLVKAIAFKRNVTVVSISSPKMLLGYGFMSKIFNVMEKYKTSVDIVATSEVSVSMSLDSISHISKIKNEIGSFADVHIEKDLSIISIVGMGFSTQTGIAGLVFSAIKDINVKMISFGASDINLTLVVNNKDLEKAVQNLHHELFNSKKESS